MGIWHQTSLTGITESELGEFLFTRGSSGTRMGLDLEAEVYVLWVLDSEQGGVSKRGSGA